MDASNTNTNHEIDGQQTLKEGALTEVEQTNVMALSEKAMLPFWRKPLVVWMFPIVLLVLFFFISEAPFNHTGLWMLIGCVGLVTVYFYWALRLAKSRQTIHDVQAIMNVTYICMMVVNGLLVASILLLGSNPDKGWGVNFIIIFLMPILMLRHLYHYSTGRILKIVAYFCLFFMIFPASVMMGLVWFVSLIPI